MNNLKIGDYVTRKLSYAFEVVVKDKQVFFELKYGLRDFNNGPEMANLYEQFKIGLTYFQIIPMFNSVSRDNELGPIVIVPWLSDKNLDTIPISQLLKNPKCKIYPPYRRIFFKRKPLVAFIGDDSMEGNPPILNNHFDKPQYSPWLLTNYDSKQGSVVPHHCGYIAFGKQENASTTTYQYIIKVTSYVKFKMARCSS